MPAAILFASPATILFGDYRYALVLSLLATLLLAKAAAAKRGRLCPNGSYARKVARHEPVSIDSGFRFARPARWS